MRLKDEPDPAPPQIYAEPPVTRLYVPGPPPVYVAPPPVVVSPYPYWGWRHPHRWQN